MVELPPDVMFDKSVRTRTPSELAASYGDIPCPADRLSSTTSNVMLSAAHPSASPRCPPSRRATPGAHTEPSPSDTYTNRTSLAGRVREEASAVENPVAKVGFTANMTTVPQERHTVPRTAAAAREGSGGTVGRGVDEIVRALEGEIVGVEFEVGVSVPPGDCVG